MPFDYDSFMQGVITGLKLGRSPTGRTPPAPSGRYILTESGEHILAEGYSTDEVTIFNVGTWYQRPGSSYAGWEQRLQFVPSGIGPTPDFPTYYFFAQFSNTTPNGALVTFWSKDKAYPSCRVRYKNPQGSITTDFELDGYGIRGGTTDLFTYSVFLGPFVTQSTYFNPPDGAGVFSGAYSADLAQFMNSLANRPLITEGG